MTRPLRPRQHKPSYPTLGQPLRYASIAFGLVMVVGTGGCIRDAVAQEIGEEEPFPLGGVPMMEPMVEQRLPVSGSLPIYLNDGSYAGITLIMQADSDYAMSQVVQDVKLLNGLIVETLSAETCETIATDAAATRLRQAINSRIGSVSHISIEVAFCETVGPLEGDVIAPEFD